MYSCTCARERVVNLKELLDKSIAAAEHDMGVKQPEKKKVGTEHIAAFREMFFKELQMRMTIKEKEDSSPADEFESNFTKLQREVKSLESAVLQQRRDVPQSFEPLFEQAIGSIVEETTNLKAAEESDNEDEEAGEVTPSLQMFQEVHTKFDAARAILSKLRGDSERLSLEANAAFHVLQQQMETE
mmetsp:Transcript_7168/g.21866  ORF Transcript_7168/g.21866 Transcript_7168/m.21866 type:complete len:186 (+) Transcript_7168:130-687(+)|eukprot:CAMPEP_0198732264 /NCGR_PEP_ID=MMETSP1475-20131203/34708_1 /TAXON_ID= ORGANISM="Unidentified sp., Strain CCMP1999" /NCGR_SAMPLE_ID=MMETSP1475 /ASSEMBLY_ACC=CAM_ASM_001111 /LENGTH=185 /DNA_ID=CAMNT_0044495333 /DNA_START=114 /DNA_END=671 /DNA_ORIENTATION=-